MALSRLSCMSQQLEKNCWQTSDSWWGVRTLRGDQVLDLIISWLAKVVPYLDGKLRIYMSIFGVAHFRKPLKQIEVEYSLELDCLSIRGLPGSMMMRCSRRFQVLDPERFWSTSLVMRFWT